MTIEQTERPLTSGGDRGPRRPGHRLSDILSRIAADPERERVSVGDLFKAMGDRTFGALMLIFALPNVFPTPPGTSAVLGAPLVFLAAQLMLGQSPWLPNFIANRSMARADFATIIARVGPWLGWAERMLKPRWSFLVQPPAEYLIGFISLVLAIVLALPIPLGNIFPAIAICLFSFGLLEKDGVCALGGYLMAIVSAVIAGGVVYGLLRGLVFLVTSALG